MLLQGVSLDKAFAFPAHKVGHLPFLRCSLLAYCMNSHLNLIKTIGGFLKSASVIDVSHVWQQAAVKCVATSAPYIASGGADDTVHIYNAKVQTSCILLILLVCKSHAHSLIGNVS